ncbi:class I glutamine amidotransferase-like protein [Byssothecium circinans]|uniref:Class I glutamine amidotransferase-like protein n=1 Tax=Byssothecium circinans TaxID=147558 RepID=A0A6A5U4W4_9PLEO|nr:class I glutamine amidotransferase-like protein [Byssothecium circinans]
MAVANQKSLRIGVLYQETQMTDLAGLDVLGNCSTRVVDLVSALIPEAAAFRPVARDMEFLYIASTLESHWTTPEMYVRPTHTYDTAPRDLDLILLGGPDPAKVPEASLKFLKEASLKTKVILTTCSGGMWLARSGVLDGKKATTNRMLLGQAKAMIPNVEWVDQRWVVDKGHHEGAELWTAGGAGCGIDMLIEFALKNFDEKLVTLTCAGLDFEIKGRSQSYAGPFVNPF